MEHPSDIAKSGNLGLMSDVCEQLRYRLMTSIQHLSVPTAESTDISLIRFIHPKVKVPQRFGIDRSCFTLKHPECHKRDLN